MHQPLEERRHFAKAIRHFLASSPLTASELGFLFTVTRSRIHSLLVSLRARGLVEPVDVVCRDARVGFEFLWRLTEHARSHDPTERLPGTSRCKHCRRSFPE